MTKKNVAKNLAIASALFIAGGTLMTDTDFGAYATQDYFPVGCPTPPPGGTSSCTSWTFGGPIPEGTVLYERPTFIARVFGAEDKKVVTDRRLQTTPIGNGDPIRLNVWWGNYEERRLYMDRSEYIKSIVQCDDGIACFVYMQLGQKGLDAIRARRNIVGNDKTLQVLCPTYGSYDRVHPSGCIDIDMYSRGMKQAADD